MAHGTRASSRLTQRLVLSTGLIAIRASSTFGAAGYRAILSRAAPSRLVVVLQAAPPAIRGGGQQADGSDHVGAIGGRQAGEDIAIDRQQLAVNLVPYNAVDHRHSYEIEQELSKLAKREVRVHFTPIYVPIVRGILDSCHGFALRDIERPQRLELYRDFYAASPFVVLCEDPPEPDVSWQTRPYPWVSAVAGTNRCLIGLDVDPERGRIAVFSALDSLGKGGARAGVENLNLMLGLERSAGLLGLGLHP